MLIYDAVQTGPRCDRTSQPAFSHSTDSASANDWHREDRKSVVYGNGEWSVDCSCVVGGQLHAGLRCSADRTSLRPHITTSFQPFNGQCLRERLASRSRECRKI